MRESARIAGRLRLVELFLDALVPKTDLNRWLLAAFMWLDLYLVRGFVPSSCWLLTSYRAFPLMWA
jgi:hypothetical protein